MRRLLTVLAATVALLGVGAAPASAGFQQAHDASFKAAFKECVYVFPNTCHDIGLAAWGGPYSTPQGNQWYNFRWNYYGYFGSRNVRCTEYYSFYSDGNFKGYYSPYTCVYV